MTVIYKNPEGKMGEVRAVIFNHIVKSLDEHGWEGTSLQADFVPELSDEDLLYFITFVDNRIKRLEKYKEIIIEVLVKRTS